METGMDHFFGIKLHQVLLRSNFFIITATSEPSPYIIVLIIKKHFQDVKSGIESRTSGLVLRYADHSVNKAFYNIKYIISVESNSNLGL